MEPACSKWPGCWNNTCCTRSRASPVSGIISSATGASLDGKSRHLWSQCLWYMCWILSVFLLQLSLWIKLVGTPDESFHISEHFIQAAPCCSNVISYYVLKCCLSRRYDRWYPEDDEDRISEIDIKVIMKIKVNYDFTHFELVGSEDILK